MLVAIVITTIVTIIITIVTIATKSALQLRLLLLFNTLEFNFDTKCNYWVVFKFGSLRND